MATASQRILRPRRICLEASTACQLKCPACPTAAGETGKRLGVGFLKIGDFQRIIDRNPWVAHVELSNWGEIFLNKDLVDIFNYAYRRNVALYAANGSNMNTIGPDALEAVVKYKVRMIRCSIDGASQETYEKYRVRGNFDRVIANIRAINAWKARYKSPFPHLLWQYVVFGHNEHEIGKARAMARELNMGFAVKVSWGDLYTAEFSPARDRDLVRRESDDGVADRAEYRERSGRDWVAEHCCPVMWYAPQVNYDGRLLGCMVNSWGDYGNVFSDGLEAGINSGRMNCARDMLMGKREAETGIPCSECKIYAWMRDHNSWVTDRDILWRHDVGRQYIMLENKILGSRPTERCARIYWRIKESPRKVGLLMRSVWRPHAVSGVAGRGRSASGDFLTSGIYRPAGPLKPDAETGWRRYPLLDGFTAGIHKFSCHVSVLSHGRSPHPPHAHEEEEILMMLSGEADLILPDIETPAGDHRRRLRPGQLVYYPAQFPHTLEAAGAEPAVYLMYKWHAKRRSAAHDQRNLPYGTFDASRFAGHPAGGRGLSSRVLFEGPTACLRKLHCHSSTLAPGSGYEPHADPYDVAIVVMEGEVETLGGRVQRHGVIFYAAGEPHGMRNPGDVPARYIVFEFH